MEELWYRRMSAARKRYEVAVIQSRKVLEDQKRWPLPGPDGSEAVRHSRMQESAALTEYMRVLKIYTALRIDGKVP